jgi:hypothetical protein
MGLVMYSAQAGLYAKGRLKTGEMNRTEAAYRDHLEAEKRAGRILEFWFEHIKLKIADNACGYTPDFMVMRADGVIELHEVKGSLRIFQEDAKVKAKVCADMYPFPVKVVWPRKKKDGGGWEEMQY